MTNYILGHINWDDNNIRMTFMYWLGTKYLIFYEKRLSQTCFIYLEIATVLCNYYILHKDKYIFILVYVYLFLWWCIAKHMKSTKTYTQCYYDLLRPSTWLFASFIFESTSKSVLVMLHEIHNKQQYLYQHCLLALDTLHCFVWHIILTISY